MTEGRRPAVVVTGMGMVTALGSSVAETWPRLIAGEDAAAPLTLFDNAGCRAHQAASCALTHTSRLPSGKIDLRPRASQLALPAAREALQQAGLLAGTTITLPELAMAVSTTGGGMSFGEEFLRGALAGRALREFPKVARYLPQQQVLDLQEDLGIRGRSFIVANACASGANAIGHAADWIQSGLESCVLTGGFEALAELIYTGFDCLQALSTEKCRPFDVNRSGLLLGEGAGFLVLESEEHAHARGAAILCRLAGYGHATDLHHLTQPSPTGVALTSSLNEAVRRAGIEPAQIAYVNAHGTATPANDGAEAGALKSFFGDSFSCVKVSSTKAAIGHTLGAAGAVEAIFAVKALQTGEVPPQINNQTPEPAIADSLARAGDTIDGASAVASVNLGFGGSNAALVFTS